MSTLSGVARGIFPYTMTIIGLPISSLLVLVAIPLVTIGYQYYICWQIKTGRRR